MGNERPGGDGLREQLPDPSAVGVDQVEAGADAVRGRPRRPPAGDSEMIRRDVAEADKELARRTGGLPMDDRAGSVAEWLAFAERSHARSGPKSDKKRKAGRRKLASC